MVKFLKKQLGFSLIETCMALIIISVIMGPLLAIYKVYRTQKARDDTYANRTLIQAALGDYYIRNGAYPTPRTSRSAPPA
jgi:prepilin-type N-terminal cleavage/methylation domain-containing protein